MIWLVIVVVVVVLAVAALSRPEPPAEASTHRVEVDLYAIRRRLDVVQFKSEVRRDAARMKRELDKELDGQARRQP